MATTNSNKTLVPQAWKGLETLKWETASEIGITNYNTVDKGNLTSRQNGSVGGFMVKKMIQDYESRIANTTR